MKRVLGKATALFVLRASQAVFGMLVVVLMSREMTEATLSVGLLLLSVTLGSGRVGVMGFDVVAIKLMGREPPQAAATRTRFADMAFRFLLCWAAMAAVLSVLLTLPAIGAQVASLGIAPGWLLVWLFLAAVQVFQAAVLLGWHRQMTSLFYMGALSNALALALIALRVFSGAELTVAAIAQAYLVGLGGSVMAAQLHIHKLMGWVMPRPGRPNGQETGFRVMAGSALTNGLAMAVTQLPLWVVAWLGSRTQVVDFGLAFRLMLPLSVILLSARNMVAPVVSRAWHDRNLIEAEPYLRQVASLALTATFLVSILLLGLHDWLFRVIFARPEAQSFAPLAWLLAGQCLLSFFGQGQLILRLADHQTLALGLVLGTAAMQAGLVVALFVQFGIAGAAFSVAIYSLLAGGLPSLGVRRLLGVTITARLAVPRGLRKAGT
ncbi:hypothetical protein [Aliiroseovarius sp.]|uniref:lipopolysaccharide biosynthesis protein n=1 Tax=Aliiroseovarius sp. TaxID=1872442 RepID=UPI0026224B63|nr:hypothetical protein [Aliiroseovarius sp.]